MEAGKTTSSQKKDILALEPILNPEIKKSEGLEEHLVLKEDSFTYGQKASQSAEVSNPVLPVSQTDETPKQLELFEEKLLSKENVKYGIMKK